jgi:pSer/pThr/pTyr-binding forkhead associated (FHA) protein
MSSQAFRIVRTFRGEQREHTLQGEVIVGRPQQDGDRSLGLDLSPDSAVSRRHARLWLADGRCWLQDVGSTTGTRVAGQDIRGQGQVEWKPDVDVVLGQTTLRLVAILPPPTAFRAEVDCEKSFNYALAYADVPFLRSLTLTNLGDRQVANVDVQVRLAPFGDSEPVRIASLPAGARHVLDRLRFPCSRSALSELQSPMKVPLEVRVNDQSVPLAEPLTVQVLPARAWPCVGHEPLLASFVLHEADGVKEIVGHAETTLRCLVRNATTFVDVRTRHANPVPTIVKALYFCLQERYAIAYSWEPRFYGSDWQPIRFPVHVLAELEGTCIDLALLFAACLENRHLSPVIVIVQTGITAEGYILQHALVGCWNGPTRPGVAIEKDGRRILEWVKKKELILLDSVGFARGKDADQLFTRCQKSALNILERACARKKGHAFRYAVDIEAARDTGCEPLPFGAAMDFDRTAWRARLEARREAARLGNPDLGARHLLLGLLRLENSLLKQVLESLSEGLAETVTSLTRSSLGTTGSASPQPPWQTTQQHDEVLQAARQQAREEKRGLVGEADLVRALLQTADNVKQVLAKAAVRPEQCLEALQVVVAGGRIPSVWHSSGFDLS